MARVVRVAAGLLVSAAAIATLSACAATSRRGRSRAPTTEPPDPPEVSYCFHALPPTLTDGTRFVRYLEAVSRCQPSRDRCEKARAAIMEHGSNSRLPVEPLTFDAELAAAGGEPPRPVSKAPPASRGPADVFVDEEMEMPPESTGSICAIDPTGCRMPVLRAVRPAGFAACTERKQVACAASYHEFNSYRPGDPEWSLNCFESLAECMSWHGAMHLHTVKRPCVEAR